MARPTDTFRLFVSSTFSDLKEERNALHARVFPKLRALCEEHGARFQAIDLRWGVREEAGLDQQTMKICLDEVKRCQALTPKPNFLVLLGDRYGWRPLPAEIPADEWKQIADHLEGQGTDGERRLGQLLEWYRLDLNARPKDDPPGVWLLRPRTEREHGTAMYEDQVVWNREVESPLRRILIEATAGLDLPLEVRLKYDASATEQEIARGALGVEDAPEHVFCFFRTIGEMPEDGRAEGYRDLVRVEGGDEAPERWAPDTEADRLLQELKGPDGKLRRRLPEGNFFSYEAGWLGSEGERRTPITTEHLDALCQDVERVLSTVIRGQVEELEKERAKITELAEEVGQHDAFIEDRTKFFVGRERTLERIGEYLQGPGGRPLALIGDPGSGKSAVMARAAEKAREEHSADARIVCRFIGWTPGSAAVRELLDKLCRQVAQLYGADEETPSDYRELVEEFPKRLALATEEQPLFLFLDALDQLSEGDNARNLIWLPAELPPHVRLVVSTSTHPGETGAVLARRLPDDCRFSLDAMPVEEAHDLLGMWFDDRDVGRSLGGRAETVQDCTGQWGYVLERYDGSQESRRPLYLKLGFEEARRWRSFDDTEGAEEGTVPGEEGAPERSVVRLAPGIGSLIHQLFDRLAEAENHGEPIVARSLGYLLAGKNGLTEDELIDVLSRDDAVLGEVKRFHDPPEEKLPVVIWSRLYFDLEGYLTRRSADRATLLAFFHRQLEEVARSRYLEPSDQEPRRKLERHRALAAYFEDPDAQPLFRKESPNVRKLSELPWQQTHAADPRNADDEMWGKLYRTLTDFDFLEAKCTHVAVTTARSDGHERKVYGGVYELQEDYRRALEVFPAA